jgi:molybdate transport system regulatory protein
LVIAGTPYSRARDAVRRKGGEPVQHKLKVWVVFEERVKFGDGRARLLELIDELGSIQKAVAQLGMSYRNAWGYLRELERAAGFKVLERGPGGGPGSGTRLTKRGRQFLDRYRRFRQAVERDIVRQFQRSFKGE